MPRKRKYPKLPNGYGSIKRLSGNRKNFLGVYPPTVEFDEEGRAKSVPALAYVDDWFYGFSILTAYRAGTYVPGVYPPKPEIKSDEMDMKELTNLVCGLLADYNQLRNIVTKKETKPKDLTFKEVYEQFLKWKFENPKKAYSASAKSAAKAGFKNCAVLHDKIFRDLRYDDLQGVLDACTLKHASIEHIRNLIRQMYEYAGLYDLCDQDYSAKIKINVSDDDEQGEPFSDSDLKKLWAHDSDPVVEFILIMCYSGHRISEYKLLEVNLDQDYFFGGLKSKSSRERYVPIHSGIKPLVQRRISRDGALLCCTPYHFRNLMYATLAQLGIDRHTPHDCRHTFSRLCEKYEVRENDRKRMLGHSFTDDVTNSVYGHRDISDLKDQIEKIKICR